MARTFGGYKKKIARKQALFGSNSFFLQSYYGTNVSGSKLSLSVKGPATNIVPGIILENQNIKYLFM